MGDAIIIAVIVCAVVLIAVRYVKRGGHGDCCGDDGGSVRLKAPRDADAAHFPHAVRVRVTGMSCENCANRVANALNAEPGVLAEVNLSEGVALVRTAEPADPERLRQVIRNAGYGAGDVSEA